MSRVVVIGGGPAGMFAAIAAAENGHHVTLLEKNEKLGKKLFITGKGRCNITNSSDMDVLFNSVMTNRKFLYSAFYAYDNQMVIDFFEQAGLPVKNERGNRIFPVSDHSSDVIAALQRVLKKDQVEIRLHSEVDTLLYEDSGEAGQKKVCGVQLSDGGKIQADDVIVATGGFSYQTTGSTGDGYRFAKEAGHTVTEIRPSLVPFNAKEDYVREMQGLSLKNVNVSIFRKNKKIYEDIVNDIDYLNNYYNELISLIEKDVYMSPSSYLIARNINIIFSSIYYVKDNIDKWYKLIEDNKNERVSYIHNNINLDHYLKSDKPYLISWNKSRVDSPIYDLLSFYKNHYLEFDFDDLFHYYESNYPLKDNERLLLFIYMAIPPKIVIDGSEYDMCIKINKNMEYLYKTSNLIMNYQK